MCVRLAVCVDIVLSLARASHPDTSVWTTTPSRSVILSFSAHYPHHSPKGSPRWTAAVHSSISSLFATPSSSDIALLDIQSGLLLFHVSLHLYFSGKAVYLHRRSLPKSSIPVHETVVALTASILGGFGVVALFNTAGVYV